MFQPLRTRDSNPDNSLYITNAWCLSHPNAFPRVLTVFQQARCYILVLDNLLSRTFLWLMVSMVTSELRMRPGLDRVLSGRQHRGGGWGPRGAGEHPRGREGGENRRRDGRVEQKQYLTWLTQASFLSCNFSHLCNISYKWLVIDLRKDREHLHTINSLFCPLSDHRVDIFVSTKQHFE